MSVARDRLLPGSKPHASGAEFLQNILVWNTGRIMRPCCVNAGEHFRVDGRFLLSNQIITRQRAVIVVPI